MKNRCNIGDKLKLSNLIVIKAEKKVLIRKERHLARTKVVTNRSAAEIKVFRMKTHSKWTKQWILQLQVKEIHVGKTYVALGKQTLTARRWLLNKMIHPWLSIKYAPIKVDMVADALVVQKETIVVGKAIRKAVEQLQRFKVIQCIEANLIHQLAKVIVICSPIAMKITRTS